MLVNVRVLVNLIKNSLLSLDLASKMMCFLKPGVHNCQVGTPGETGGASSTGEEELGTRDCKLCTLINPADCTLSNIEAHSETFARAQKD